MSSVSMGQELEFLAEKYILDFGIKTHRDLKRVREFKALPEDSQRKLYDKVRYRTQRGNLRLVTDPLVLETKKRPDPIGSQKLKFKDKTKSASTILLLAFIFFFLASESLKFYDQFEILPIFKYSIPVMIEFSVLLLSFKKSIFAKALLAGLIIFNTATFTYKTIESDRNLTNERQGRVLKAKYHQEYKINLEKQIKDLSDELLNTRKHFEELISKNYFKLANGTYAQSIKLKESELSNLKRKAELNDLELLKVNTVRGNNSFLSIDGASMIALKLILQGIFVFFILDLKNQYNRGDL